LTAAATHDAIRAVYKLESAKVIAVLTRILRDVGVAEELAHDALVAALEQWPKSGIPDNPGAWLMTTAKHHALNVLRKQKLTAKKHEEIGHALEAGRDLSTPDLEAAMDEDVGDELLRLIFVACHPVLSTDARVALTLRLLGGLTTDEIARAFLVAEPTIAQRIVRAKRTLADEGVPFEVPRGEELEARLSSVLEVVYLIFNEGYSATAGDDWQRPALCDEALRLGRVLAELAPGEPEVHGLVSLMEIQASRTAARTGASGEAILLRDQDRTRWDRDAIQRGLTALGRAESLGLGYGPYMLQAAIAVCHAQAATAEATNWSRIVALYTELVRLLPSPIIELNRAVAVGMAEGPEAGLRLVDRLRREKSLERYHLLPSVRGDFLIKLGRLEEARAELERAADLTRNLRERELLLERARSLAPRSN
jgi:RNA polymerase sigma factor (sigma-70 family)